jgi:hypothetical protein
MSALPWLGRRSANVGYGSVFGMRIQDVRFTPESGHTQRQNRCPLSANSGHSVHPRHQGFACLQVTSTLARGPVGRAEAPSQH